MSDKMSDEYMEITERLFKKHLAKSTLGIFITQANMSKKLKRTVEEAVKRNGELFVSEVIIITEPLSFLAEKEVKRIAKRCGYSATCRNSNEQLRYLGSDFGGHYSTDYYELLIYAEIRITLFQPPTGEHDENS